MRLCTRVLNCAQTTNRSNESLVGARWFFLALLCLVVLSPLGLQAQNFVYVNNTQGATNSVVAFAADAGGVLTAVPGSPFATGGTGAAAACPGIDRITVSPAGNHLFVSNAGNQTISAFQINPATGALTPAPGSPFASGLTLDACNGISLAATPDGAFLMASSNGTIKTFSVAANGALSAPQTLSGLATPMVGMKISANGKFLASPNPASASVFAIAVDGSLTAAPGSPFARTGANSLSGLEFSCASDRLYSAEGGNAGLSIADAWSVAANGALAPLGASPFSAAGNDSNIVFLTPDNTVLYQSNQGNNSINGFPVNADGTLAAGINTTAATTHLSGLAGDNSGLFLYAADDTFGVAVYNIFPDGTATLVADNPITGAGQIQGVAAYPPRSCVQTDFAITQTASPNPVTAGTNVTYTITITNNGPNAAAVAVNDVLPTTTTFVSCAATGGGVCDKGAGKNRTITFASLASGASGTVTLVATTNSTLLNLDTVANTSTVSNSSAFDPNPVNNSASTSVTISAPPATTKFVVQNSAGTYFGTTTLSAQLQRVTPNANIAGRTVTFSISGLGTVGTAVTNATGVATLPNVSLAPLTVRVDTAGITASFAGDDQYAPASANATLTVNPATLTVTAQDASRVYGDANPTFTFVISGFLNNETTAVVSGAPSCSSSANVNTAVGTGTIVCIKGTLAATNYIFIFVNATLTITKAPLVAAGNDVSRLYGDVNPTITGTVVGLKAGDKANATFSTTASITSPVGVYPITGVIVGVGGFNANNYTITSSGNVTVTPAPLTVAAVNVSRLYGDPNPSFAGAITGLKNGDAITATFSVAADPTSAVGIYPITPTFADPGAKLPNYNVVTSGTLTILPAPLTVTANNATRLYGDPNPAFTGTVTGQRNSDVISATFSTTAVAASPVGTYSIVATLVDPGNKAGNYTFTPSSGTLTVTQAPLSVVAANANRLYGDANPAFTGTITGLKNADAITATYASVADPTSAVGTFPITPTLVDPTGKLPNYAVLSTNGTLTVNPAPLSVTAASTTRLYGDPNPVFAGTITGIKNADAITATYASTATAASSVGTFPIVPTVVDPTTKLGNYTVTSNNGTLTVGPALLTVTGGNATRPYGDPNPVFTGTITGIKNADNITATFASAATPATSVGTALIVPTLVDPNTRLGNYTVTSVNGTLTINPAPLAISATDATRAYGDANPPFTGSVTGLKNGDVITATFSTTATSLSNVGAFPIVPTPVDAGNKLGNYTVTATNGTLTVTQAPLTVTAGNATRIYGDPNPAFSGTILGLKNGDNITATVTGASPTSPVGTYPLVPVLVDPGNKLGNYSPTITNGTLTVTPAALSVSAANASRAYGDANPAFTGTITGIKNGDAITATFASAATLTTGVGTSPIVPTLAAPAGLLSNYTVTSNNGVLTIAPAALTVTGTNANRLYGDPNPAFTGVITGIKNADAITATFASAATTATAVGTSPIVPTLAAPAGVLANYSVTSVNGVLTINPAALTVTTANATRLYGDPNPAFTGTITGIRNADNITATFSSAATLTTGVGPASIVPTLVDPTVKLGNYLVTSNNGVLTITPAPLTVTAGNVSRIYGDPNPAFTGTITGLKNGDNITATVSGTGADPTSPVGTYPLVPALVDPTGKLGNYNVTTNDGVLTVTAAPLTITASNASRAYGDANPVFSATVSGLKNGDAITATFSTAATLTSPVGTFAIVPSAVDSVPSKLGNYTVALNNGTLTVAPAALTITAANATRLYGDANPVFTGTLTGLKNADAITATFTSAATPASTVGNAAIVAAAVDSVPSKLGNYSVTLVNGTLAITPAPLTITGANANRLYGDANPAFTGTVSGLKNADNITATFATAATAATGVGQAAIVPTPVDPTGKLGNYSVALNNGVLTINPAPLTVSAGSVSRLYGDPNPAFVGTIIGLKNGDPITAAVGGPGADQTTPIGTFVLVPALVDPQGKAVNYTVTFNNGTLTITAAPLTITANASSRSYGDANPAFSATFTGLKNSDAITASFTTAATAASPVGTFTIIPTAVDAAPSKLGNYTVTLVNGTLTVAPAPLTIAATNATRLYGDANPAFTGAITGLKNADIITASFTTAATATSPVGNVAIVPTAVDSVPSKLGNYTVNLVNGTLAITPAPLTLTAANATRLYGDANPAFTGTIAGVKNADNITASFSTTATLATGVGSVAIVPVAVDPTSKLGNYTVVLNNGVLTITLAPLTVTAGSVSRLYGDPNPPFVGTILGLKNGDSITATVSGAGADPASPVGTYVLVPALVDPNNKAGNYSITLNNGTLTITVVPLAVSVAPAARAYGDPNPAFVATFSGLRNADNITATFSSASQTSPIGSFPIVPTLVDPGARLGNYSVTITNGTLTINPAALTVAGANATRLYGDANPVFTGTLTGVKNADPITATFASAALVTSPVGNFAIVPTLADPATKLGNYTVTSLNGTLAITAAPLNVSSVSANRLYGDPNPAFTGTVTGQKSGDTITATFDSAATATSAVGTYPITATLADPGSKLTNYSVVANNGTLTVNPVALTVTAGNASRLYGDPNPAFTGTITGLRNADNITASFTSAAATAAIGVYPITPVLADPTGKLGNYAVTSNSGVLTVSAAALSVTTANASRAYGAANPVFTGTITGIKNADNITATFSSAANTASAVGTYPITPTLVDPTSKVGNYVVTSANGTLTVTQAKPTVALNVQAALPNSQLTAQVQNTGPALPTGTVQFFDGATSLGVPVAVTPVGGVAQATLTVALAAGTHSITASYSGDATYIASSSTPVPVNVGGTPQFGLNGNGGNTSATVAAGKDAIYNISLANQGFAGNITFSCAGAPAGTTCTVNPNPLTVIATQSSVPITVTISNTQNARLKPFGSKMPMFVFAGVFVGLASGLSKKRRQLVLVMLAMLMIGSMVACGGGSLSVSNGGGRGPTSAVVTITGTSASQTATINLNLTITH